jgi:hypothetical protein
MGPEGDGPLTVTKALRKPLPMGSVGVITRYVRENFFSPINLRPRPPSDLRRVGGSVASRALAILAVSSSGGGEAPRRQCLPARLMGTLLYRTRQAVAPPTWPLARECNSGGLRWSRCLNRGCS